nr:ankyrin repeat-containing protein At5g02620-like [Ziziphus jujuba var. spinosa]
MGYEETGMTRIQKEETSVLSHFVHEVFFKLSSSSMLEKADDFGWIPLHYAAHLGNRELVELFLNYNNSLTYKKNEKGMSALHISAMKGHVDVVRTLINKCPDICELKDDRDRTALHVAVESREEEVVKFLLESIAFQDLINEKDNEGNTALHTASSGGDFKILQILANDSYIDRGATNKGGMTFAEIILSTNLLNDTEIVSIHA